MSRPLGDILDRGLAKTQTLNEYACEMNQRGAEKRMEFDRLSVREQLKRQRERRTTKVRSVLP